MDENPKLPSLKVDTLTENNYNDCRLFITSNGFEPVSWVEFDE
jgi:hypothetical protein